MKRKAIVMLLAAAMTAGTMAPASVHAAEEGKVINIYSWNDEFRQRVEAVYSEVVETSEDGTVTTVEGTTETKEITRPFQFVAE